MGTASSKNASYRVADAEKVGIIRARYNERLTQELTNGCVKRLKALGASDDQIVVKEVAGAVELPVAAQWMLQAGYDAVVCIGVVIRGDTPHFDYVCDAVTYGTQRLALDESKPVTFCVLTTEDERQAWDRTGGRVGHKGEEAADTVVEMLTLKRELQQA